MKKATLSKTETEAILRLKKVLSERYCLLDFRIFGSKVRGAATPDSDIDIMIELEETNPAIESEIDDLVFETNLTFDCFITTIIFSKKELAEGPLGESPIYKVIEKEGVRV